MKKDDSGHLSSDPRHPKTGSHPHSEWHPSHSPWLIACAVMLATFMEVLDTSVANVALPHIAGNLSASTHESTWVLTSYLVSNAIILPATAWFGGLFGRKRFLMICILIFTIASALCGIASSLGLLIFARILQGVGGGALQPISQAILLESFPREKRGVAMAVFSLGVIVAPIVGPTVGGWITDNYSWRWIFYINVPVGALAMIMSKMFVEDPPYLKKNSFRDIDAIGFSLMAVGLAALQIVLDKGQEVDWFSAPWICWATGLVIVSLTSFFFWELRVRNPVVDLRILKDLNFTTGTFLVTLIGAVLYSTTALLPLYLQSLMGYTAYLSGLALSPRGIAAFLMAMIIGRLIGRVDSRYFIMGGLLLLGLSCVMLGNINLEIGFDNVIVAVMANGVAIAAIFVPLATLTMGTLPRHEMGNAAGLFNLMRNIGGSFGIAITTTLLARFSQIHQNVLVSHLTPYDPAYQLYFQKIQGLLTQAGAVANPMLSYAAIYRELGRQAALWSFVENFRWLGLLCLICAPSVFLFRKPKIQGEALAVH
jgi:DHA2 family multidrug resistance protein